MRHICYYQYNNYIKSVLVLPRCSCPVSPMCLLLPLVCANIEAVPLSNQCSSCRDFGQLGSLSHRLVHDIIYNYHDITIIVNLKKNER